MSTATDETEKTADEEAIDAANATDDADLGSDDKTIEELAKEDTPTPPMQLAIPGTLERLPGRMGGVKPTSSEIRLMGGKLPVEGVFEKGEIVELVIKAKITGAGEFDTVDAWGTTEKTTRRHFARMIEVTRHDAP